MKKNIIILSLAILFILTLTQVKPVWANLDARVTQTTGKITAVASKAAEKQSIALQNLITRADSMITTRITSLNELLARVQKDTRLSTDEKTSLTTNINTMITNLQTLKTKIDADTDLTIARTDAKSIVTSYHVYVTFDPQIRLLTSVDNLLTTTTTIQNLVPKLQALSTTMKNEGKDTTAIDAAITDISTQLTAITALLGQDKTTLGAVILTNANYQTTFTQVRQDLAKVRADFAQIQHDMATIRGDIHGLTTESSLKIHPSITPGAKCLTRPACLSAHPACAITQPIDGWCPSTSSGSTIPTTTTATPTP